MKKQELTNREMVDLFEKYYSKGFIMALISSLPFFLSVSISTLAISLDMGLEWRIVGLVTILIAIVCVVLSISFLVKSHYWNKKSSEPPKWIKEANEREKRARARQWQE